MSFARSAKATPALLCALAAALVSKNMVQCKAEVIWVRGTQTFVDSRYSRKHVLRFDGGVEVPGSSSPHIVPVPMSDVSAVDPEEAFIASLSSCHMLWFLSIAAKRKYCVDRYVDAAIGVLDKNPEGKTIISVVTLRPAVSFAGENIPTNEEIEQMHHEAHEECFIANSVKSEVQCHPIYAH